MTDEMNRRWSVAEIKQYVWVENQHIQNNENVKVAALNWLIRQDILMPSPDTTLSYVVETL